MDEKENKQTNKQSRLGHGIFLKQSTAVKLTKTASCYRIERIITAIQILIFSQFNLVHNTTRNFSKIEFNIILQSMSTYECK